MMLNDALEKFPLSLKLRDGTPCVIRPLGKRDDTRLHKFFLAVPEEERLFIKQSIFDRELVRDWCRHPDFERNLPLLMLHGQKIIGEATLHQRFGGWKRHIGLISVLTHPQYRGRDVAKILVAEQVEIARTLGLARLEAELNGERKVAIRALEADRVSVPDATGGLRPRHESRDARFRADGHEPEDGRGIRRRGRMNLTAGW